MRLKAKEDKIKKIMAEQGVGSTMLTEETGLNYATVRGLMKGNTCHPKTARAFCDYFAVDIWECFELFD